MQMLMTEDLPERAGMLEGVKIRKHSWSQNDLGTYRPENWLTHFTISQYHVKFVYKDLLIFAYLN